MARFKVKLTGSIGLEQSVLWELRMSEELERHRPLILLLVRVIGVFFFVDGLVGLVGHGIDLWQAVRASFIYETPFAGGYPLGWTVASGVYLLAGFILIFKTQIAMDAIFHERFEKRDSDEDG